MGSPTVLDPNVDVRQPVVAVVVAWLLLLPVRARRRPFFPFFFGRAPADRTDSVCGTCGLDRRDRAHAACWVFAVSSVSVAVVTACLTCRSRKMSIA